MPPRCHPHATPNPTTITPPLHHHYTTITPPLRDDTPASITVRPCAEAAADAVEAALAAAALDEAAETAAAGAYTRPFFGST